MSSMVLPYRHINAIVTFWSDEWRKMGSPISSQEKQKIGERLLKENVRNVTRFYNIQVDNAYLDGYFFEVERKFVSKSKLPLAVLKLCLSWEYQSCDTPKGDEQIWNLLDWIKYRAIEAIKQYDELPWILENV